MKITQVGSLPPLPPIFDEIKIGDVFERADVNTPKTVYLKINNAEAFDMKFPRIKVMDGEERVNVLCAELTVGPQDG